MITVLVLLTGGGAMVGSAVIARHRAQAAADLAALAGAARIGSGGATACASAASVSLAMRARMSECALDGLDVTVRVEVPVGLGRWGVHVARAAARAGPVE